MKVLFKLIELKIPTFTMTDHISVKTDIMDLIKNKV